MHSVATFLCQASVWNTLEPNDKLMKTGILNKNFHNYQGKNMNGCSVTPIEPFSETIVMYQNQSIINLLDKV